MKTQVVGFDAFERVYLDVVDEVMALWTESMQLEVSRHCTGWAPGSFDFNGYLRSSTTRYFSAYRDLADRGVQSVCDVGGFFGVFAVTLSQLGFKVAMTEALRYYSGAFDPQFAMIREQGVKIIDSAVFEEKIKSAQGEYDAVTLMAVLEHYPHSQRFLMVNIRHLLRDAGLLYIDVPNIAYWPNRWHLLMGKSPLVSVEDIYQSQVPFIGHHHEFTAQELETLVRLAGFKVNFIHYYNYSRPRIDTWQKFRWRISPAGWGENIAGAIYRLFPQTRECIGLSCQKTQLPGSH